MNCLSIAQDLGLSPKKVASAHGGEYASACPFCGGNDRFHIWPEKGKHGACWCRQCGFKGDAIEILMKAKGMTFKEAAAAVGKTLESRQRAHTPREPKRQADWLPREVSAPAELWQARASAFAEACHKELLGNKEQLAWLGGRGITVETARRFRLGWNAEKLSRKRPTWGLEVKTEIVNGKEKLKEWICLSVGLVIPYFVDGRIHRLRIRKPEGEPRYLVVPGSGMAPMIIPSTVSLDKRGGAWVIVESELDALLIAQDAGDLAGVAALGSVATKPDGALYEALKAADSVLVALDADEAGLKGWPWWQEHFTQADRWPVPRGKDPGDYLKQGGNIREWVISGLPYGLRPAAPAANNFCEKGHELSNPAKNISETKVPPAETNRAESETGTGTCQKGLIAGFETSDDVVKQEHPSSGGEGVLVPYDGTWPPITREQAMEMGYKFHENACGKCGHKRVYLWPQGQKPPEVPACCAPPKAERKEKRHYGRV